MKLRKYNINLKLFIILVLFLFLLVPFNINIPSTEATVVTQTIIVNSDSDDGTTDYYGTDYETARNRTTGIVWPSGAIFFNVGQTKVGSIYYVYRTFFFFDTSSIPSSASITNVTFSFYLMTNYTTTDFNVTVQNGQPTYPHQPIQDIDYYYIRYSGDGGQFNTSGLTSGYNNLTLNSQGISWVNVDGTTKLCIRSSRDINNIAPTGEERFTMRSRESGEAQAPKLYVTYETESFNYIFHGLYNEDTGLLTVDGVNVTAYFTDGSPSQTFEVNGTYSLNFSSQPRYFLFNLTNDREYWESEDAVTGEIYIFNGSTTQYTISFLDLVGALDDRPFVEAKRYINGTLRIVERRRVDVEQKIEMNLINGVTYTMTIQDGTSYTYGDLCMTSTTSVQLTLKGLDFPQNILLGYRYVRIYAYRTLGSNGTDNITIIYQDTLTETTSVTIYIRYENGTTAYNATETSSSFSHTWANAYNRSNFYVYALISHTRFGSFDWSSYLPRSWSTSPWSLPILGTLPFATSTLIPMLIIVFSVGVFSALTVPVAGIGVISVATLLAWWGWYDINANSLVAGWTFAIIIAIVWAKRRISV